MQSNTEWRPWVAAIVLSLGAFFGLYYGRLLQCRAQLVYFAGLSKNWSHSDNSLEALSPLPLKSICEEDAALDGKSHGYFAYPVAKVLLVKLGLVR